MFETVVTLKPEEQWRPGMTWDKLLDEMDHKVRFPGMPNIWWMPIQTRNEMLSTGVRSRSRHQGLRRGPQGDRPHRATTSSSLVRDVPGTRSAFAERTTGGYYLDFTREPRDAIARYG